MNRRVWCEPVPQEYTRSLRIIVEPGASVEPNDSAVLDAWSRLCAANARLYDGPILSVAAVEAAGGEIIARRASYMLHAVGDEIDTGVRLLSVTGVLITSEDDGSERVLLGRRSEDSHSYPGMWEFGPSGGITPPTGAGAATITHNEIVTHLERELREELGMDVRVGDAPAAALCHDEATRSVDVVLVARISADSLPRAIVRNEFQWEYQEYCWRQVRELPAFLGTHPAIPPTRSIAALMGWY